MVGEKSSGVVGEELIGGARLENMFAKRYTESGFQKTYDLLIKNSTLLGVTEDKAEVYETGGCLITIVDLAQQEFRTMTKGVLGEHDYKQMKYELLETLEV